MLNLKKTAVAVLAFGSSAVFAGTMGPVCSAINVTVPCERTGWGFGVQALYLNPNYNQDYGYVGIASAATIGGSTVAEFIEPRPDWAWGFKLEGSYYFNTGNDWTLNWYHLGRNTHTTAFGGPFAFGDLPDTATETFSIAPRWDAVNLEFGQHVDFSENKKIRFHGGVQYANIRTETVFAGATSAFVTPFVSSFALDTESKFSGFGPRIGADMSYQWGNGFAMYANGATALLIGRGKIDQFLGATFLGVPTGSFAITGSRTEFVPELEAKLGLTYTYAMAQGDLTLDAGYMWVDYLNAQQFSFPGLIPSNSDFSLNGPYFGLKWVGNFV